MADPMKIRGVVQGTTGELRLMLAHVMETGQRKDDGGKIIPAHFIQTVDIQLNGQTVISGQLGTAVSRNPVFVFRLKGVKAGDKVAVSWVDNKGEQRRDEAVFAAA